ncbi:MAG: hypothetical protein PHP08_04245 [Candidatus Dojkabacteria bacterium]|nr:hypothetical protein [Candidatus Dojkabacteria bacterium]
MDNDTLTTTLEVQEINGSQIYYSALSEIESYEKSNITEIPDDFILEREILYDYTKNLILSSEGTPPPGISAEVLFYIALKNKLSIRPATLKEDFLGHFDFLIDGQQVDVTCCIDHPTLFKEKWTKDHPITLLVPIAPLEDYKYSKHSVDYAPFYTSYTYKLIFENTFNIDMFLRDTLNINNEMLEILKNCYWKKAYNKFGFKESQMGNITWNLIDNYKKLLTNLSISSDIPIKIR